MYRIMGCYHVLLTREYAMIDNLAGWGSYPSAGPTSMAVKFSIGERRETP